MSQPRSIRILVVDDDPELREALLDTLSSEFEAVGAHNGAAALAAQPGDFDVILLDLDMPVLDGVDFKRAIDGEGMRVPIVVMSAARDGLLRSAALGASAFLRKPVQRDAIVGAILSILAICSARGA